MALFFGNSTLTTIGVILLLHSTYSCLQYRALALVADIPDTSSPPIDVIIEVLLGFIICLVGQLSCGQFHQVRRGVASGSMLLGKIESQNSVSNQLKGEIIAPAYRTRDFDLVTTRMKSLSIVKRD